jgi:dihydrofolate reductase
VPTFQGDVAELHAKLVSAAGGRDVWVVGGGHVAAQFVAAGLIDEMIVSYAPCSLGTGAPVLPLRSEWQLTEVGRNADFVCARWVAG